MQVVLKTKKRKKEEKAFKMNVFFSLMFLSIVFMNPNDNLIVVLYSILSIVYIIISCFYYQDLKSKNPSNCEQQEREEEDEREIYARFRLNRRIRNRRFVKSLTNPSKEYSFWVFALEKQKKREKKW